ncbi:MAG: hypothetical protein KatS3mg057_2830 [Herpetosiphonaceae bacterium]|nr:MAG: hypothetical protein KatS3mg057_2830 [Herpetosiphonaceae bacterium]
MVAVDGQPGGAFLALPTAIKIYPAYLLIHGAALRRWRSLAAFAGASAALLILSIVVLGLDIHRMYFFEVFSTIGGGTSWVENQTINGFLNRLVTPGFVIFQPDTPGFIRICAYLAGGLVSLITFMRVQKMQPDAGFGLWIVALLLVLPAAWIHYQAILLIPLYQLLVRIERSPGALSWRVLLLYCLAWALLASGNQWTFFDKTLHGPIWALFLSYKFYGLLLLWLALLFDATARTTTVAQFAHVSEPSSLEPAFAMPIHHDYSKS